MVTMCRSYKKTLAVQASCFSLSLLSLFSLSLSLSLSLLTSFLM